MKKDLNQMRYEFALRRVEELLPLVDDSKPASAPEAIELAIMSDFVIAYEKEYFPIGNTATLALKTITTANGYDNTYAVTLDAYDNAKAIYHDETFMTPTMGDYTVIEQKVTDGATWQTGTDVTGLFLEHTTSYDIPRDVWWAYYNPNTGVSYGVAASAQGAIKAPTTTIVNGNTVIDYHRQKFASRARLASKEIDLSCSAGATVSFYHAGNGFYLNDRSDIAQSQENMKADCSVLFSKDGGTNWVEQTVRYWPSGAGYVYVKTAIDIPAEYCTSQFLIMFQYTSTPSRCGTWEVEKLKIFEN